MNNFDNKQRKEFKIKDIFITDKKWKSNQVPTWASITTRNLIEWETPRITVTWLNNWIIWNFADMNDVNYRVYEKFISVSFLWTIFYHNYKASLDMKVHCLKPINFDLNNYTWKYLVSVLRKSIANSSYADQISSTVLPDMLLYLPVDNEWNPDREYMENYIKNLEDKCKTKLQNLILARGGVARLINTNLWKEFKVWDLFEISSPSPRSQNNYEDWEVPFVASWDVNNWILKYCNPKSCENLDSWNCITVSPVDWSSFYQNDNFLGRWWAGSSIMILRNEKLNKYCWLFIAWIIRKCSNFTYNDMWYSEILKKLIIILPVVIEWYLNRAYMESYMKNLMEKNQKKLQSLH